MNDLFFSLLNILVVVLLLFFMGSVSTFLLEKISKKKIPFFLSPILGLLISILAISIVKTGFSSIMVISFIPLLFLYQFGNSNRQIFDHPTLNVKKQIPNILFVVLLAFGFSIFEFINVYSSEYDKVLISPHFDYTWYARISHYMDLKGAENQVGLTNLLSDSTIRQPYHYPEIWFNVFAKQFSKLSYLHVLLLVAYPVMKSLVVFLFYSYATNSQSNKNLWFKIFILLCITISPLMLSELYEKSEVFKYHIGLTQSGLFSPHGKKYYIIYILAILLIFEGIKNKNFIFISATSSLIFLSSVGTIALPIYFAAIILPFFFIKKTINFKTFSISLLCIILTIVSFIGFYLYFGNGLGNKNITNSLSIIEFIKNPTVQYLKKQSFILIFNSLRFLVFYSPFLFLILLMKVSFSHIINFLFLSLSGILLAMFTYGVLDSGQFFYNILPIINVYLAYLITEKIETKKLKLAYPVLLIIFFVNVLNYSKYQKNVEEFYNKTPLSIANYNLNLVNNTLKGELNIGAYEISNDSNEILDLKSTYHKSNQQYLLYSNKVIDLMNLSLLTFISNEEKLSMSDLYGLKASEIYYFLNQNNLEPTPENIEILKRKLNVTFEIENNNINFRL